MASKSGQKHHVLLRETTQVFKGSYQLTYASDDNDDSPDGSAVYDVRGFPVVYGDAVGVRYTDASGEKGLVQFVTIVKADGSIAPF